MSEDGSKGRSRRRKIPPGPNTAKIRRTNSPSSRTVEVISPAPSTCVRAIIMAPLVLEGETLGEKHQHYNKLLRAAVEDKTAPVPPLNYDDPDVDNLLRIDVACSRRDVEYVVRVLQGDDMLYASRAVKRSTWLITDDQYAHIINPKNLYDNVFPKMMPKIQNKLLLAIRLNLKNESRVEEFFKYYSDDVKVAQKWLPRCSSATIEKFYSKHAKDISPDTFKRLCEQSINFLKILLKIRDRYYIGNQLDVSKILIKKYAEEYIDIMKTVERHSVKFGIKATQQIMRNCPDTIIKNFKTFAYHLHLPTFAKYLKKDDIQDFLQKQASDKQMQRWIKYDNIKHFMKYLPVATRFDFVKKLFIDKEMMAKTEGSAPYNDCMPLMRCGMSACMSAGPSTNANIYRWYRFAPFDMAFPELKKMIRVESSPAERNAILTVLIQCARRNPEHVKTLLQFYREKHMNEPFKFKVQFANSLVSLVESHKFDASTWGILNDIFTSMEVYIESENSVPYCVKAIIVYKLLHQEEIPEIIEKKYNFDTFKDYRKRLEIDEGVKLFSYLYNLQINKLNKLTINNEIEMTMASESLTNILNLLKEWDKDIADYPAVLEKIQHFIKCKKENSIEGNLCFIFDVEKKWRKDLFEESLFLKPNDEACVNALKHDPSLLLRHNDELAAMCANDSISLKNTLFKLRVYWAHSIAATWADTYLEGFNKQTGHKATVEGICVLLPRKRLLNLVEKYTPVETKIDWSNVDPALLSLQKNIAKRLKLVRPSMNLEAVLPYAKGDYLQFVLPSLNALLYNMSAIEVSKYIPILFDSPVSLKKHGLRLAYTKFKFTEIKELVENLWNNTKNASVKSVLFKETYELLKKAKKDSDVHELWNLLSMFVDILTPEENRVIYEALGKVDQIPLAVRPQFFVKSYKYLSSLPPKANCEMIVKRLRQQAPGIIDSVDQDFVQDVLLKPVAEIVTTMTSKPNRYKSDIHVDIPILSAYIFASKNYEIQNATLNKYLIPLMDGCLASWKNTAESEFIVRNNCVSLLNSILGDFKRSVLKKPDIDPKMWSEIFKRIESKLRTLPIEENYELITFWTIAGILVESFSNLKKEPLKLEVDVAEDSEENDAIMLSCPPDDIDSKDDKEKEEWKKLCLSIAPQFGRACTSYLKQDLASQITSVASHFYKSLEDVFDKVSFNYLARLHTLKAMLDSEVTASYHVVLQGMQLSYYNEEDEEKKLKKEIFGIIKAHPSADVKIHYYEYMYSDPHQFIEATPYTTGDLV